MKQREQCKKRQMKTFTWLDKNPCMLIYEILQYYYRKRKNLNYCLYLWEKYLVDWTKLWLCSYNNLQFLSSTLVKSRHRIQIFWCKASTHNLDHQLTNVRWFNLSRAFDFVLLNRFFITLIAHAMKNDIYEFIYQSTALHTI